MLDDLRDGDPFFTGFGFAVTGGAVREVKGLTPLVGGSAAVHVFQEHVDPSV